MIYVFYSAPIPLPRDFKSPLFFLSMRRDQDCRRIIENTRTKEIFIEKKDSEGLTIKADDERRYDIMKKLISNLEPNTTVVMPDITTLSQNAKEVVSLYMMFIEKGTDLEFVDSPWLNTSNKMLMIEQNPIEMRITLASDILMTMEWKRKDSILDEMYRDVSITQASQKEKKQELQK